jgi:hypothetical protein
LTRHDKQVLPSRPWEFHPEPLTGIRAGSRTSVTRYEVFFGDNGVCTADLGTFMARRVHATDPENMPFPFDSGKC